MKGDGFKHGVVALRIGGGRGVALTLEALN